MKNISIIGGGPAALILASYIDTSKYSVTIYEKKKAVGRKFLVAGEGGLNLTFNEPLDDLIKKYSPNKFMEPFLRNFTNDDLRKWFKTLDIPTFLGSSNRVFPTKDLKPIDVLNKMVNHLVDRGIKFEFDKTWIGWTKSDDLTFEDKTEVKTDITVFAMGGASWKVTGSDGFWANAFESKKIKVVPFKAANSAFGVEWDKNFINTHAGKPLKNIEVNFKRQKSKGELVITKFGLEGNAIYALSEKIQKAIAKGENVLLGLDLKPTMTKTQLKAKYKKSKLTKVTDILKEDLKLDRSAVGLLKHFTDKETFMNPDLLVGAIKSIPMIVTGVDEIDKAISTLGGIAGSALDDDLQIKKIPNSYAIGEMVDWYAPTGGYLLQGSFSMGFTLAEHLNKLEKQK